jgi:rhamnulose-1-phosphate aldolase
MISTTPFSPALQRVLEDAAEVAGYLWDKGWAERNAGNISIDVTGLFPEQPGEIRGLPTRTLSQIYPALAGHYFLVTGAQKRMRELCREPAEGICLIQVSAEATSYRVFWPGGSGYWPTSELPAHLGIHQFLHQEGRPQRAAVHTHPNEIIALTHLPAFAGDEGALNGMLWSMHPETKQVAPEGVGLVPYRRPGSQELADATVTALRGHRLVAWEKHGALAVGIDVFEAFDLIDTVNKSAQIYLLCKMAGSEPEGLSQAQISDLSGAAQTR